MKRLTLFLSLMTCYWTDASGPTAWKTPKKLGLQNAREDARLDTPDLLKKYGYPCETHTVQTADGYLLQIHRIPSNRTIATKKLLPVVVVHGLGGTSADFLLLGPGNALAYLLSDAGHDVWLANARGTKYSRRHVSLDPETDARYWSFSFHEIAVYDLPAVIDRVLAATAHADLFYVGYSQGTTSFFAMMAARPEYNRKVRAQFSMAPVAYISNAQSLPILLLTRSYVLPKTILPLIGDVNLNRAQTLLNKLGAAYCSGPIAGIVCSSYLFALFGVNAKEYDRAVIAVASGHVPGGFASRQLIHYGQLIWSGRFCRFDHGIFGNLLRYGAYRPPDYNLTRVTVPVHLYYGDNDRVADVRDVRRLRKSLPNVKGFVRVADPLWTHSDFAIGASARTKVYEKMLNAMVVHSAS